MKKSSVSMFAGLLLGLTVASCTPVQAEARAHRHVLAGVDISGSARNVAAAYGQGLRRVAMRLNSHRDSLTIVRFGTTSEEVYNGAAPTSSEQFTEFYNENFAKGSKGLGTYPAKLFEYFNACLDRMPQSSQVSIVVFTDGGNDDMSGQGKSAYRAAIERLAQDPRVERVVFAGVRPGLREDVYKLFSPLGGKLVIQGEDNLQVNIG